MTTEVAKLLEIQLNDFSTKLHGKLNSIRIWSLRKPNGNKAIVTIRNFRILLSYFWISFTNSATSGKRRRRGPVHGPNSLLYFLKPWHVH